MLLNRIEGLLGSFVCQFFHVITPHIGRQIEIYVNVHCDGFRSSGVDSYVEGGYLFYRDL